MINSYQEKIYYFTKTSEEIRVYS